MINFMNKYLVLSLIALVLVSQTRVALASDITIWPLVIDESLSARETVTKTISLTSNYTNRKAVLYATVNEITIDEKGAVKEFVSPVVTDRTNTVTSWINITRGRIEIDPGQVTEVSLTVTTHPQAEPGDYYVFIGFVEASKRYQAEAVALAGQAKGVVLKVSIADSRQDSLHLKRFSIDRFVTGGSDRNITIEVENNGELPTVPSGEIIFYDSRGIERSAVLVDALTEPIQPGETKQINAVVPIENTLGKFKAKLALAYGSNQQASLQDTTFFFMMPVHLMLMLMAGGLIILLLVFYLFKRTFLSRREEDSEELPLYVNQGHSAEPKQHDIDLKNKE